MKQLYRIITSATHDMRYCYKTSTSRLHYEEVPDKESLLHYKTMNFMDAYAFVESHQCGYYTAITLIRKQPAIVYDGDFTEHCITKKKFNYFCVQQDIKIYPSKFFTFEQLTKELPADEFLEWCNDVKSKEQIDNE